jgi:photosystem II stability/assembly factor-like uncharacterized protein
MKNLCSFRQSAILRMVFLLCAFVPLQSFGQWHSQPCGVPGVNAVGTDSSGRRVILSTNSAGMWRSQSGGSQWEPISTRIMPSPFYCESIQPLDARADTVILTLGSNDSLSQVWYTFNGGSDWTHLPDNMVNGNTGDYLIIRRNHHNEWIHAYQSGVHRSDDYGQTWQTLPFLNDHLPTQFTGLYEDPDRDSTLFLTGYFRLVQTGDSVVGIARSTDLGESWQPLSGVHQGMAGTQGVVNRMIRLSNQTLLASVSCFDCTPMGSLMQSTDNGTTWTLAGTGLPESFWPASVIEDRQQPGTLLVAGQNVYGLFRSLDYGLSWIRCQSDLPQQVGYMRGLTQNPFSGKISVCIPGWGVYTSLNHGESWQEMQLPVLGQTGQFGEVNSSVFMLSDGGRQFRLDGVDGQWQEIEMPWAQDTLTFVQPIYAHSGDTLVSGLWKQGFLQRSSSFQIIYSNNNGLSWAMLPFSWTPISSVYSYHRGTISRLLYTAYNDDRHDRLCMSQDLGRQWISTLLSIATARSFLQNDSMIYMSTVDWDVPAYSIYRWMAPVGSAQNLNYPGIYSADIRPSVLIGDELIVCGVDHCYHWRQGEWDSRGTVPDVEDLNYMIAVPTAGRTWLFGLGLSENHAWLSPDTGRTWQLRDISHPIDGQWFGFTGLAWSEEQQRIWAISGAGTCYLEPSDLGTDGPLHFNPVDFTVLSCYPNPFNSSTRISFDLERPAQASIKLYDLQGRLVRTLTDGLRSAGTHDLLLDGADLASGTYFLRLDTGKIQRSHKLLLLR